MDVEPGPGASGAREGDSDTVVPASYSVRLTTSRRSYELRADGAGRRPPSSEPAGEGARSTPSRLRPSAPVETGANAGTVATSWACRSSIGRHAEVGAQRRGQVGGDDPVRPG